MIKFVKRIFLDKINKILFKIEYVTRKISYIINWKGNFHELKYKTIISSNFTSQKSIQIFFLKWKNKNENIIQLIFNYKKMSPLSY